MHVGGLSLQIPLSAQGSIPLYILCTQTVTRRAQCIETDICIERERLHKVVVKERQRKGDKSNKKKLFRDELLPIYSKDGRE